MNKAIVVLTLALALGVAVAPTAAASCPPSGPGYYCDLVPIGQGVGCIITWYGDYASEAADDCL